MICEENKKEIMETMRNKIDELVTELQALQQEIVKKQEIIKQKDSIIYGLEKQVNK